MYDTFTNSAKMRLSKDSEANLAPKNNLFWFQQEQINHQEKKQLANAVAHYVKPPTKQSRNSEGENVVIDLKDTLVYLLRQSLHEDQKHILSFTNLQ